MSIKKIVKNSFVYGSGIFLINATGFLLIPFYTRFLTPSDYGIISTLSVIVTVLTTFYFLGQDSAVSRFFFDYKEEGMRRRYFSTIWFFMTGFCLLASVFLTFVGPFVFEKVFKEISFNPFGIIVIWTCFFSFFESIPMAILRSEERALRFSIINYVSFVVKVALLIYFIAFLHKGALGKVQADLIWSAMFAAFFLFIMRRYTNLSFSLSDLKKSLGFGLPLVPHDLSIWSLNLCDRIILQYLVSFQATGIYSLGYNLSLILNFLSTAVGKAWTPHFFGNAEGSVAKAAYSRMTTYYALIVVFSGMVIAALRRELLAVLSTPEYYEAASVIPIAVAGYVFHSLYKVNSRILHYVKKTKFIGYSTVTCAIVNIILNFILIKRMGMIGAAWATLISFGLLYAITYYYSQLFYKVAFEKLRVLKAVVCALIVYYGVSGVSIGNRWSALGIKFVLASLAFSALLYFSGFFLREELSKAGYYFRRAGDSLCRRRA